MPFLARIGPPEETSYWWWNGSVWTIEGGGFILELPTVRIKGLLSQLIEVLGQGSLDKRMNLQVLQESYIFV
jgi:hypothetical protein